MYNKTNNGEASSKKNCFRFPVNQQYQQNKSVSSRYRFVYMFTCAKLFFLYTQDVRWYSLIFFMNQNEKLYALTLSNGFFLIY